MTSEGHLPSGDRQLTQHCRTIKTMAEMGKRRDFVIPRTQRLFVLLFAGIFHESQQNLTVSDIPIGVKYSCKRR